VNEGESETGPASSLANGAADTPSEEAWLSSSTAAAWPATLVPASEKASARAFEASIAASSSSYLRVRSGEKERGAAGNKCEASSRRL
jgi:hypothetical protein